MRRGRRFFSNLMTSLNVFRFFFHDIDTIHDQNAAVAVAARGEVFSGGPAPSPQSPFLNSTTFSMKLSPVLRTMTFGKECGVL